MDDTPTFLHERYAADHPDLAEGYGSDNAAALREHFAQHGRGELRGIDPRHHIRIERMLISDAGDVLLMGWADRRLIEHIELTVEIGYVRHPLGERVWTWHDRPDVSASTGDATRPQGFAILSMLSESPTNPLVRVVANGCSVLLENNPFRFVSRDRFLLEMLAAISGIVAQPPARAMASARAIAPFAQRLWLDLAREMRFTRAFANRPDAAVERTVVVTLHRTSDMLLPQLESLADYLEGSRTEVVIVGNDLLQPDRLIERLHAFCQTCDASISLHLCSGNSGFSVANNYGAGVARGGTLLFLNPDIFPAEHDPGASLAFLDRDPGDALHGALLYYGDGLLMHSGMYATADRAIDPRDGRTETLLRIEHFGKGLAHRIDGPEGELREVMAPLARAPVLASAALWKMRRALFEAHGGLREDYIVAYYEDADFCLRLLESGTDILIDPSARWVHLEGLDSASPAVRSFNWLNRAIFTERFRGSPFVVGPEVDRVAL